MVSRSKAFAGRLQERWSGLADLPARTALRIINYPWICHWLGKCHQRALATHAPRLPMLSIGDQQIVDALNERGVFITSLDQLALPQTSQLVGDASRLADQFAAEARRLVAGGAAFVIVPPDGIVDEPLIYEWGLNERLLAVAEVYLGLPPAYDGVTINYTVADGREISTRKWHRDWEDRRMLKVAIYLHDVDAAGGPFEMLSRPVPGQDDITGYHYALVAEADLEEMIGKDFRSAIVSCEGRRGTVIFTDTARYFHRGKPALARDRTAVFYSYFSHRPRHPFYCERTGLSRSDIDTLAATLNAPQRRAALWRRRLPFWVRSIPRAQL